MAVETVLAGALILFAGVLFAGFTFIARALRADPVPEAKPLEATAPVDSLERLAVCERKLESLFALRAEWATYQEIIDDALETAEVKRRRAAASASKRAKPTPEEIAALTAGAAEAGLIPAAPSNVSQFAGVTDRSELRRRAAAAGKL